MSCCTGRHVCHAVLVNTGRTRWHKVQYQLLYLPIDAGSILKMSMSSVGGQITPVISEDIKVHTHTCAHTYTHMHTHTHIHTHTYTHICTHTYTHIHTHTHAHTHTYTHICTHTCIHSSDVHRCVCLAALKHSRVAQLKYCVRPSAQAWIDNVPCTLYSQCSSTGCTLIRYVITKHGIYFTAVLNNCNMSRIHRMPSSTKR